MASSNIFDTIVKKFTLTNDVKDFDLIVKNLVEQEKMDDSVGVNLLYDLYQKLLGSTALDYSLKDLQENYFVARFSKDSLLCSEMLDLYGDEESMTKGLSNGNTQYIDGYFYLLLKHDWNIQDFYDKANIDMKS